MTNPKGTKWESAIVAYLSQWWPHVERRAKTGRDDRGDIAGLPGVCIEAKREQRVDLAGWLTEAKREGVNAKARISVAWAHRRGKASPADGYVVIDGATFVYLLKEAGW